MGGFKRAENIWLALLITLLAVCSQYWQWNGSLDRLFYDSSQRFSTTAKSKDIVIVAIDERSLLSLGHWPWSRLRHAELLAELTEANATAVVFDVIFAEADQSASNVDQQFAGAIQNNGRVILPIYMNQLHRNGQILEVPPIEPLYSAAAAVGHVHPEFDIDGISRSVHLYQGLGSAYWPHIGLALDQLLLPQREGRPSADLSRTSSMMQLNLQHKKLVPVSRSPDRFIVVSYIDVLEGKIPQLLLKDKIIFVGATAFGLGDTLSTPIGTIYGVEWNAAVFDAARKNSFIEPLESLSVAITLGFILFCLLLALSRLPPRALLVSCISIAILIYLSSFLLVSYFKLWIAPSSFILAIMVFYPLWNWRRLELALSFLRDELVRSRAQISRSSSVPSLAKVSMGLRWLESIEVVNAWVVQGTTDQQVKESSASSINQAAKQTQRNITIAEQEFTVTIQWREVDQLAEERYLKQLLNVEQAEFQKNIWGKELVSRTIGELTQAEQQLAEGKQLIRNSLADLQDAIIIADNCGRVSLINSQAHYLFGDAVDLQNQHLLDICSQVKLLGELQWDNLFQSMLRVGEPQQSEGAHERLKRDLFCQINMLDIEHSSQYIIATFTDVTKIKESERARSEALQFLSHDIRSPMVSILAILEQAETGQAYRDRQDLLSSIRRYVDKNLEFSENFLHLAKAESAVSESFELCDMHAVIDSVVVTASPFAQSQHIKLIGERCLEDAWVLGNRDLLERALLNLVNNAIKYCPGGSEIRIGLSLAESMVTISVTDNGPGINEKEQLSLFDRFKRGSASGGKLGAGLGLYFVKAVAERHSGSVFVESTLGQGSSFKFRLPTIDITDEIVNSP